MNNLYSEEKIEAYIFKLFKDQLPDYCVYHNFNHTQQTVEAVKLLQEHYNLNDEDKENLVIAAWFHDAGYTKDYKKP